MKNEIKIGDTFFHTEGSYFSTVLNVRENGFFEVLIDNVFEGYSFGIMCLINGFHQKTSREEHLNLLNTWKEGYRRNKHEIPRAIKRFSENNPMPSKYYYALFLMLQNGKRVFCRYKDKGSNCVVNYFEVDTENNIRLNSNENIVMPFDFESFNLWCKVRDLEFFI